MNGLNLHLLLLLLVGTALRADPATIAPTPSVDPLGEALPILQASYPGFPALHYHPGDHLSDLIARSGGNISINAPTTTSSAEPIITSNLPGDILYWRLASFAPKTTWLDLGAQLQQGGESMSGIVLDLRSNLAPDDYVGAAQVLDLFASSDTTLSQFLTNQAQGSGMHPFQSPIVVLTNNETNGAAEALAACLQADGALIVGRATAGKMGVFEDYKLQSGQILRYFASPLLSVNTGGMFKLRHSLPAWNQPVVPDISVSVDDQIEKSALALIRDNHLSEVIQESSERHRMSEAELVQGNDPEWDDYLASLEKKPDAHFLLSLPPIHDVVLISAIDSLKAIRVSQGLSPSSSDATTTTSAPASLQ
jgi:hypothetical protein